MTGEIHMIMQKVSLAFLATLFLASCNAPLANPVPERQDMQSQEATQQNEALVRKYYELFNAHRWEDMAALYAPSAQFKDPSLGQGIVPQTREQIAKKYSELAGTFPDIKDTVVATYPSGSKHIIVEFVSSGTAPDGSRFELPIATIFTIENGLITQDFTYYDNFGEG
jgi:steroid delta-isomerase-like uncharacterized protein